MEEIGADFAVQLSSDLISEIVQEYFDKKLFKRKVEILDLKPTQEGYAFVVTFVKIGIKPDGVSSLSQVTQQAAQNGHTPVQRNSKGRFVTTGEKG